MTAIYYTQCKQLPDHAFEEAVFLLPIEMQQKIRKYSRWQDAHACLYGNLLLKEAISQLGYDYSLELIQKTKYGKPYFKDSDFGFNISHSGEYIVCVISTDEKQNLGIDIEENKPIALEGFMNIFTEEEQKEIGEQNNFYTFWTRKEAIAKADGRGMLIPFDTINTLSLSVQLDNKEYNLYEVDIDQNYTIYIAASVSLGNNIKYFYKDPGSLY
ncbi:4'-phosphopantetheinyl transferase superfamily protein [Chryseobacterium sp. G0162]|uniref:4'-phosphopantetheinyl transferase family protein n=1 Tax=Chryseobacterium sp. G0162 TaxID=2487063 RepID=UPI000F5032FD|nr:4'-phosphopantetheinyl transferase superfamily protein [Chryseobacterium sp. G0162]AZB09364.1 4'-phosphopantetheinyl transferase superfamily protein [Chryseobacterium sp. G0162]